MSPTAPKPPLSRVYVTAIRILLGAIITWLSLALILYLKANDFMRDDYPYVHNSYNWTAFKEFHPIAPGDLIRLPTGGTTLPRVQHDFNQHSDSSNTAADARRELLQSRASAVKQACVKTWRAYSTYALPHDQLLPLTLGWTDPLGGWGATMVDGLDTLWIMGLKKEFYSAVKQIARINWTNERYLSLNLFETTIRYLGGLLSAHDLSGIPVLLHKAQELADMLIVAFDTPDRMPPYWFSYSEARKGTQAAGSNQASSSATSLCLEFTRLAQLTGQDKYYDAVQRVTLFLASTQNSTFLPGMWPATLDFWDLRAQGTTYTLGSGADSLYEYLIKMHVLLSGAEPLYEMLYRTAAETARKSLLFRPMVPPDDYGTTASPDILLLGSASVTYAGADPDIVPDVEHLGCFAGGMFALGGKILNLPLHLDAGEKIARGCAWAYSVSSHGIMPEKATLAPCPPANTSEQDQCTFNLTTWQAYSGGTTKNGPFTAVLDGQYLLRPEAIESLFILYRITGLPELQDTAWDMWTAIMNATETADAFAAVKDVTIVPGDEEGTGNGRVELEDDMESFWVAETLKYFYLIFSPPDLISLDEYVFSTEAHPFKRI